jgi:hypothetical protein
MRAIIFTVLVSLMSGCQQGAPSGPPAPPPSPTPIGSAIYLSDDAAALERGVYTTVFNFYDLRELWVRVVTPSMPHSTLLRLSFENPNGVMVYSDEALFTSDPSGGSGMHPVMNVSMVRFPVKPFPGGSALDRPVPVTGTSFVRNFEEGDWRVQAWLEGVPGTLSATMKVVALR